jgi:uncharacterized protein (DUF2267 family)
MQEIVQKLIQELNLDEAVAKQAVEAILGALKEKLPAPIAEQLEGVLNGENFDASQLGDLLGGGDKGVLGGIGDMLGGLLGGDKK